MPCDAARNDRDRTAGRYSDTTDKQDLTFTQTDWNMDVEVVAGIDSTQVVGPGDTTGVVAAPHWRDSLSGRAGVTGTAGSDSGTKDAEQVTGTGHEGPKHLDSDAGTV